MGIRLFLFFIPAALATIITSPPKIYAQEIQDLQEQVSELKAQENSEFNIEQAEFERMRLQLLQKEREILEGVNENPESRETSTSNSVDSFAKMPLQGNKSNPDIEIQEETNVSQALKEQEAILQSKKQIASLKSEIQDLRNKLLIAESEIERLNSRPSSKAAEQLLPTANIEDRILFNTADRANSNQDQLEESATIITVVSESGALRTAPSASASIIMEVDSGARLNVDDRRGEWFRVSTSSGMRAWISTADVAFGPSNSASPSATVKIRPSRTEQNAEEERAFELIKNR